MEWSKIKNIILVILLAVNLILLGMVSYQEYQSARYDAQTLESAVTLLASNGISVEAELPQPSDLPVLQLELAAPDDQRQEEQVEAVLGGVENVTDSGGGSRLRYRGAWGDGELSPDGHFSFTLGEGALPAETDREAQGALLLAGLGMQVTLAGRSSQEGQEVLTYWQVWNGVPVFTCQCTVTYQGDSVVELSGRRIQGHTSTVSTQSALTVPTVLVRFLTGMTQNGYVCSTITAMTQGYSTALANNRLTPVWALETDTGRFYINAVTGAFSRAEE